MYFSTCHRSQERNIDGDDREEKKKKISHGHA